jgi:hypothetical protein
MMASLAGGSRAKTLPRGGLSVSAKVSPGKKVAPSAVGLIVVILIVGALLIMLAWGGKGDA